MDFRLHLPAIAWFSAKNSAGDFDCWISLRDDFDDLGAMVYRVGRVGVDNLITEFLIDYLCRLFILIKSIIFTFIEQSFELIHK